MSAQSQARYVKIGNRAWSHKSVLALLDSANGRADPESLIRDRARTLVAQALALRWPGPPYDPKILAGLRDIIVEPTDENIGAEARILARPDGSLLIQYDPTKAAARVNFSICHEITHTFFPDCFETIHRRHGQHDHDYELECLCDLGSAELLMPHESFERDLTSLGVSLNSVRELTVRYGASGEAVLIRIAQLSNNPCAVVFLSEKMKPVQERAALTKELDFGLPAVAQKLRVDYVYHEGLERRADDERLANDAVLPRNRLAVGIQSSADRMKRPWPIISPAHVVFTCPDYFHWLLDRL